MRPLKLPIFLKHTLINEAKKSRQKQKNFGSVRLLISIVISIYISNIPFTIEVAVESSKVIIPISIAINAA